MFQLVFRSHLFSILARKRRGGKQRHVIEILGWINASVKHCIITITCVYSVYLRIMLLLRAAMRK